MREIKAEAISQTVTQLCKEANFNLREDVRASLRSALKREDSPRAREIIKDLLKFTPRTRKLFMLLFGATIKHITIMLL